jgi:cell division protease FtsH
LVVVVAEEERESRRAEQREEVARERVFAGRAVARDAQHERVASNDFERATKIARDMVTRYGMSDLLGPMVYADNEGEVFLGRSVTQTRTMSETTMQTVDKEIRRIIDEQYAVSTKILKDHAEQVEAMTAALMEYETIDADQIADIMAGRLVRAEKTYNTPGSSGGGDSSASGPVVPVASEGAGKADATSPAAASPKAAPDTL